MATGPEEPVVAFGDLFAPSFQRVEFVFRTDDGKEVKQAVDTADSATTEADLTGEVVWPASHVLAWFLLAKRHLVASHRLLAVGCGSGLCGLVAAQVAQHVVLTDGVPEIMDLLRGNVAKYAKYPDRASALPLDWGDADQIAAVKRHAAADDTGHFHVVIGAGVLYPFFPGAIDQLFATLKAVLHPRGAFLTATTTRSDTIDAEVAAAAAGVGMVCESLGLTFLPTPVPPALARVLAVEEMSVRVFAWEGDAIRPWRLR